MNFSCSLLKATSDSVPGTIFFVSAGITTTAIVLNLTVNFLLKGSKMTDLTQYIDTPEDTNKAGIIPGIAPPPYHTVAGISSF